MPENWKKIPDWLILNNERFVDRSAKLWKITARVVIETYQLWRFQYQSGLHSWQNVQGSWICHNKIPEIFFLKCTTLQMLFRLSVIHFLDSAKIISSSRPVLVFCRHNPELHEIVSTYTMLFSDEQGSTMVPRYMHHMRKNVSPTVFDTAVLCRWIGRNSAVCGETRKSQLLFLKGVFMRREQIAGPVRCLQIEM